MPRARLKEILPPLHARVGDLTLQQLLQALAAAGFLSRANEALGMEAAEWSTTEEMAAAARRAGAPRMTLKAFQRLYQRREDIRLMSRRMGERLRWPTQKVLIALGLREDIEE